MTMLLVAMLMAAQSVQREGNTVTIRPAEGQARVVRLQVVGDKIIRVRATSEAELPVKKPSLMITAPTEKGVPFTVSEQDGVVSVKAKGVEARVDKQSGRVTFYDADGQQLLQEAQEGKTFKKFRVPDREIGVDINKVPESQRNGLTWRMLFDSPDNEAFYGLGQHQSEELNMKGLNEDLFQYNTKVSVPFVLSSRNYGLLWDSYSYCRWGNPDEYMQLGTAFKIYDKKGREGHLTGTYTDRTGKRLVRDEDSIYFEFDCPATSDRQVPCPSACDSR